MTRTDIYKASKSIFPGLADEETFAIDMQDTEKANRAFQSALNNKDKYDEMGVTLPDTVEEFQAIVTTDPKKKSTNTGSNGSQKTQQSSGSKPAQSSQQGPRVFQPQRVFNSAEEIDNYFGYLDQYKNDPNAQKEKQWFDQNYPTISEQFYNQGGKPLTIQGPVYEEQKQPSFKYDPGTLPKLQQKSTINNADLKDKSIGESSTDEYTIDPETGKKIWKALTDEELAQGLMDEISPRQDNLNVPSNIRQQEIQIQEQEKIKEAGEKVKGMTLQQIEEQYKQDLEEIDKQELYRKNYGLIESMIDNQFGGRSNDIDFKKLNVINRSEVENAYGLLEQDYLEYLQKTNPQEYERVNNEITAIKGKKSDERSLGEKEVLENYRVQAMKMHNLLNGYVMTKLEKDYDIKGFYGGINVINSQVEAIDKQLKEMNIDPSGRGVTQPMMDKYNELVQKRNKLVSQVASLAEKTGVTPEIQAKYEDALGRYTDSKITTSQLRSLDSEVMKQKEENAFAAKKRFDEAMSGDYSIAGEFARGYAGTVGKSFVDFIGSTWDIAGEAWGDTDYDIFDQMSNFVKGYTLQKQETFGTAQDMAFMGDPKKYEDLPLIYRLNNLTSSGLASISLAASGSLATGALGLGSTVGGGLLMMGSTLADNYEEALSMGYSGQEAAEFASSIAAAEYMVESFFPDFNLFKVPQARNTFFQALKKTNSIKEALAVTFEQLPKSLKYQAKKSADNFFKEGVIEEGGAQGLTDLIKTGFNEKNQDKGQFETFQSQDYLDTVVGGWLGAEGARVVGRLAKPFMPHEESAFYQAAINPQILQIAQSNEVEFPDEVQEIIDEFAVINNAMKSKPGWDNMTDDEKAHVVSEVRRMKYLESKNKEVGIDDPGTKEEISNIKAAVEQYIDQARNNPKFKLPQYALQEPSTEEVLPRQQGATTETGGEPQGMGQSVQGEVVAQEGQEVSQESVKPELENNPELIEQKRIETQSQIERTDLFDGVGNFSSELGGSDKAAVPTNRQKINEIEFVQYSHPETGSLDVIVTGTSDNDFVGFYRVYENGKPTNKWSSKFENQSRSKENFKTMISNAQDMLPEGHEYMEKTSISTDGLRVWNQQLDRGYELQYDENGKLKTNLVAINGDAIVNELGIPVKKGDFDNIRVSNKEDFENVKKVLLPYLEKFGLDESNIRWLTGTVKIDLPVLLKSPKKQEVIQEGVKKEDVVNQPFGELPENTEDFTGIGAGYLKNNLWASKQLGKDSKTSLLGNVKNEVLNKGKKAFLYFIDPKLSEGQLDTENKYNTKLNDKINAQGNKTLSGAENAAIENEVGAELAKEGVKGELVSDEKDGTYRIFDTKNTELLGYIEATPELIEKISDPNISEEQAKQILFDEAGVKMGDNVLIHANENDITKYKPQEQKGPVNKKEDLINKPFGKLPVIDSSFMEAGAGVGQGYLPHNIWTNKELDRKSDTGLFGNIKYQFEKYNKDKVNLYFLDPKLSNKDLAEAEENEVKFGKIQNEADQESNSDDVLKDFDGNRYKAFNNLIDNKLAKAADEGLRVSSFGKGGYRIHDSKNTDLVGYLEVTPELMERISDPNISEEEANAILKKEAGVPVDKEVFIHINENDLSKYKTQKDVESEDYVGKLEEAKKQKPEKLWSVSTPPVGDVKGGTLIKVKGGEAIVDKTGEIRGLYKYPDTEERGVGDQLVKKGIEAGGVKLDNFALDNLMDIYQRNGFKVVSRLPFSEKDAPEGWKKKEHGTPDVVAMIYDPENKLDIEEKQFTKDQYDEALAYRDSFVDAQKEAYGKQKPSQDEEAKRKSIADIIRGLKSKGGKLYSAGLGIPVAIWDGAVEIVASAVQAGESVSKALNKAKKYLKDNLKDKYNEEVFNKLKEETEKQSGQKSNALNIDVESVRKKDRPGKRISKGLAKKGAKDVVFSETDDLSIDYVKKNAPQQFIKNARIIAEYPLVKAVLKGKKINTVEDAQKVYDVFIRQVADNLKYLMDEFDPELKEVSTLWYDGANAIANELAEEYGITPEQVAGIIASLSPQKDWYQNVRLAELVLIAYKDNPVLSQEMIDYQKKTIKTGLYDGAASPGKKLNKAELAYKKNKTVVNKKALEEAKIKMDQAVQKSNDLLVMLESNIGKKLDQVPDYVQPYMVRTYHEVNTTKDYDIVTPDGNKAGVAKKQNGENAKVAWGSFTEIGKAVSIFNDGSSDNITRTLGEYHKIRNFYNNIIDPMSKDGDVTIDTHAVAAALLMPLSGNAKQVGENFGTGTSNSAPFGIKGLYFAYADAYALASKETGLLPRQVQSITWEAVRGLYKDTFKSNSNNVEDINQIWKKYENGEITIEQARELAKERAGGIEQPSWVSGSVQEESRGSDTETSIGTGVKGDGSDTVRSERKQPDGDLLTEAVEMLSDAQESGGTEVTKAQKEVTEKLGEEGKKIAEIDRNFDKLADDLGFIKTCII